MTELTRERVKQYANGDWPDNFHDGIKQMAHMLLTVMQQKPVAWTDAEELRDLERDGYAAMLSVKNKDPNTDPHRQIFLYTTPQPVPDLPDVIDAIVDEVLASDTIASTAALRAVFHLKTGKMRLDSAAAASCHKEVSGA
ncbi:TPA: hypothetical protein I8Y21_005047 [Klebsiella oxytoca]|uniref:Uncharacterized protein n=1 Tax=Klebsiella oxytoca TaxID=571 RepID=A0AAN5LD45_KLEOX|nr:hypothetical protein [Klebsiella oxytoca]